MVNPSVLFRFDFRCSARLVIDPFLMLFRRGARFAKGSYWQVGVLAHVFEFRDRGWVFFPCGTGGPGSSPLTFVSYSDWVSSADFPNMADFAAIVIYLVFIGAIFSIMMDFIFSATWAQFVWLVVSIFLFSARWSF